MLEKLLEQLHIKKFNKHDKLQSEKQRHIKAKFLKETCLKIIEMEVTTNTHLLTNIRF